MTTYQDSINVTTDRRTGAHRSGTRIGRLQGRLADWSERARRRRELEDILHMPEHLLKDMGISRDEVYREYRKPFWRA